MHGYNFPFALDVMQALTDANNRVEFFQNMVTAVNVIMYTNLATIQTLLRRIVARQRWTLAWNDRLHSTVSGVYYGGVTNYDVFIRRHFNVVQAMFRYWGQQVIGQGQRAWGSDPAMSAALATMLATINGAAFFMGFLDNTRSREFFPLPNVPPW